MEMTVFDWSVLATIAAFVLFSAWRGFAVEVLNLAGWVVSLVLARLLAVSVAETLLSSMRPHAMAVVVGFIGVFVACRFGHALLGKLLTGAIEKSPLNATNRLLGAAVGAVKGTIVVTLGVMLLSFTSAPRMPEWRDAPTAPVFEDLAQMALPYLPDFLAQYSEFPNRDPNAPQRAPNNKPDQPIPLE
ncbi:CvpA family protein [Kingella sp. SNUBH-2017]|uniref:CvpA family protein n=1 Tax=Kingella sp. SNUBH-2017 TaxID=2994077 RepID=UPI0023649FD1|nr:CvpA family protein [Kingella sp. SNUBH-2017]MDD2183490.1 CvpA family protein [Kingella sp. SNUBH-2017]